MLKAGINNLGSEKNERIANQTRIKYTSWVYIRTIAK